MFLCNKEPVFHQLSPSLLSLAFLSGHFECCRTPSTSYLTACFRTLTISSYLQTEMLLFFSTALWAGALLVCVHLYRRWNAYAEFRAAAIQHGCQRPRRYPHQYPVWGYDLYRERETATRRGYLMKLYEQHFTLYGKTFEEQFFDTIVINTMEPANIQQITTVSVQDWAKPATRKRAVDSFFGEGILSQDGPVWKHSRALIRPTFARTEVANLTSLSCYTGRLLELIPRDGSSVDLQPLLRKFV
jgi:hypothetical protein